MNDINCISLSSLNNHLKYHKNWIIPLTYTIIIIQLLYKHYFGQCPAKLLHVFQHEKWQTTVRLINPSQLHWTLTHWYIELCTLPWQKCETDRSFVKHTSFFFTLENFVYNLRDILISKLRNLCSDQTALMIINTWLLTACLCY
jgi:hypothetical protein